MISDVRECLEEETKGYLDEYGLRLIADVLEDLNWEWYQIIQEAQ